LWAFSADIIILKLSSSIAYNQRFAWIPTLDPILAFMTEMSKFYDQVQCQLSLDPAHHHNEEYTRNYATTFL
jgi:hypothetical protein